MDQPLSPSDDLRRVLARVVDAEPYRVRRVTIELFTDPITYKASITAPEGVDDGDSLLHGELLGESSS